MTSGLHGWILNLGITSSIDSRQGGVRVAFEHDNSYMTSGLRGWIINLRPLLTHVEEILGWPLCMKEVI